MGSPRLPPPPLLDPAWYPDPTGRYEARYWDGRRWTSHISHYGATGADPLIRARWDRWWVRIGLKLIMWGALIGLGWWAFDKYWPTDDRDLAAEQELVEAAVLQPSDLPPSGSWTVASRTAISPLILDVSEEGEVSQPSCDVLSDSISDAADEPRAGIGYDAADGLQWIGEANTIGAGQGFGKKYLDDLRNPAAGVCLGELWATSLGATNVTVASVTVMSEPSFGDEAVWWRLEGTDSSGAFPIEVIVDLVFVRVDRVVAEFSFSGAVEPIGVDVERDVVSAEVRRIEALLTEYEADDGEDGGDEPADTGTDGQ